MNLRQTIPWQHRSKFGAQLRVAPDSFFLFELIKYLNPQKILEIGFSEGFTVGLYLDAVPTVIVDCVDLSWQHSKIFSVGADQSRTKLHKIDSRQLDFVSEFDFINVDANHDYEFALNDINKALQALKPSGLIMIDDWPGEGVTRAVKECLEKQLITPLFQTEQMLFAVRGNEQIDLNPYFDSMRERTQEFTTWHQENYFGHQITRVRYQQCWTRYPDLFHKLIELYEL
jgi:predicted O-methyltransferase YrrM